MSQPTTRATSARSTTASARWLAPLLLVIAVLAAYANTWRAPFVYDDAEAIVGNPSIRQLWPPGPVLLPATPGGATVSGRPVLNLSFALNYAISRYDVWSYHAMNMLLHAGSTLVLLGLLRRTLPRALTLGPAWATRSRSQLPEAGDHVRGIEGMSAVIAALWALHPLQTQAVTYTVQRAESLMGFFYLLTLYAFVRARDAEAGEAASARRTRRWTVVCIVACVLGMGTKEVMATAPLLVLLYDRTFIAGSFGAAWRARRGTYLALAATWIVLGALVLSTGGNRGGTVGFGVGVPLWAYPLTQFQAVARYLGLSLWPHPLVFEYGTWWVQGPGDILPYALVVLPLLAATGWALVRRPALGFLGAWFFLILAPTSLAPGTIQMIVEHRMYLPLAAVVVGAGVALHRLAGRAAIEMALLAAAACLALTITRNRDYRSHLALWEKTVAQRPENPRAREGLAEAYEELGRLDDAIVQRRETVRLKPDESTYHYNLGRDLAEAGQTDATIRAYEQSLRLQPAEAKAHNNLALALGRAGRAEQALAHFAAAERLKPDEALFFANHATALVRLGRLAEAVSLYETALRLRPRDADTLTAYGGALLMSGRAEESLAALQTALTVQPGLVAAMFGRANALAALGRRDEALAEYGELLKRAPEHADGHFKLGNLLVRIKRVAEAVPHYEAAVRLNAGDAEAHHNLGVAYARLERFPEAGREFAEAVRLKPDYAEARQHLAQVRELLGR